MTQIKDDIKNIFDYAFMSLEKTKSSRISTQMAVQDDTMAIVSSAITVTIAAAVATLLILRKR